MAAPTEAQLREAYAKVGSLCAVLESAGLFASELAEALPGSPGEGFGNLSVELYNCATELREAFSAQKEAFHG